MRVILPNPKCIAWTKNIQDISSKHETKAKNLETLIRRLNHIVLIIPLARNFFARIRYFQSKMIAFVWLRLWPNIRDNLKLHIRILQKSYKGISMNLLTYREPTRIYLTDACKIGMSGFSSKGRLCRWQIPKEYLSRAYINLLEFFSELLSIWIDIVEETMDDK